jgi:hypothetical protein
MLADWRKDHPSRLREHLSKTFDEDTEDDLAYSLAIVCASDSLNDSSGHEKTGASILQAQVVPNAVPISSGSVLSRWNLQLLVSRRFQDGLRQTSTSVLEEHLEK